jgi:hypothetical protein
MIKVMWPDGKQSILKSVISNQLLDITYSSAVEETNDEQTYNKKIFIDVSNESQIDFVHRENEFTDFDREPLLPYQLSRMGPALAKGDVNNDGIDDFYAGGAIGQAGQLYIGDGLGHFRTSKVNPWEEDIKKEDTGATFFDADGDGDLDLFVVSGGNEYLQGSDFLDDRLYINLGNGDFVRDNTIADHASGSCVAAADYDNDGDIDLFVGGRSLPGSFPGTSPGAILRNDTDPKTREVKFSVVTNEVNAGLREPGMVMDASWTDFNGDGWLDLLIVGEWMPIRLFENQNGKLVEIHNQTLDYSHGLWTKISPTDYDNDGDTDFVLGNAGNNLPWKISATEPLVLYPVDLNGDGTIDPIICYTSYGKEYPVASRDDLLHQVSQLRKNFTTYSQYANANSENILGKELLKNNRNLMVETSSSSVLENLGGGNFKLSPLPKMAQVSRISGLVTADFNHDGFVDILMAGNFYSFRTEYGRSDASIGLLLLGNGTGGFEPVSWSESGFFASGDIRNMTTLTGSDNRKFIILARNDDRMSLIEVNDIDQKNL